MEKRVSNSHLIDLHVQGIPVTDVRNMYLLVRNKWARIYQCFESKLKSFLILFSGPIPANSHTLGVTFAPAD